MAKKKTTSKRAAGNRKAAELQASLERALMAACAAGNDSAKVVIAALLAIEDRAALEPLVKAAAGLLKASDSPFRGFLPVETKMEAGQLSITVIHGWATLPPEARAKFEDFYIAAVRRFMKAVGADLAVLDSRIVHALDVAAEVSSDRIAHVQPDVEGLAEKRAVVLLRELGVEAKAAWKMVNGAANDRDRRARPAD